MGKLFLALARGMAVLGGIVLGLLVLLTCLSVAGRVLNTALHGETAQSLFPGLAERLLDWGVGPILGDFELVEAGMAFTIFAFLPLCQIAGAHASVDIFTARLPGRARRALEAVIEWVFAAVLILIAWQLWLGLLDKMRYNETTYLLQFPIWWAYAASLFAAVVAALTGVWVALARLVESVSGRVILHGDTGSEA